MLVGNATMLGGTTRCWEGETAIGSDAADPRRDALMGEGERWRSVPLQTSTLRIVDELPVLHTRLKHVRCKAARRLPPFLCLRDTGLADVERAEASLYSCDVDPTPALQRTDHGQNARSIAEPPHPLVQ